MAAILDFRSEHFLDFLAFLAFFFFFFFFRSASNPDYSYQVSSQMAFDSDEVQIKFSRPWRPSWIADRNDFSCFICKSQ